MAGDFDGVEDDLDAFMDELEASAAEERGQPGRPAPPQPAAAPSRAASDDPAPPADGSGLAQTVSEFMPLERRRSRGEPLAPAEEERWSELREILEYHLGSASPPLGGTRRASLRVPTGLKIRTPGLGDGVCSLHDLSRTGSFFESGELPEVGSTLTLELDAGAGRPALRVTAVVRWCRELPNMDGPAGVGVEFTGLEDDDASVLAGVVEAQLLELARRAH